jgi:tetrahydromethanopterin S-methyltransferase subunit G
MVLLTVPRPLREKLGDEATDAFVLVINNLEFESKKDLATKTDILEVKADLDSRVDNVNFELNRKIDKLGNKIDNVHAELNSKIDKTATEIKSDIKLLQWMIGIMFAGVLSLVMKAFF